MDTYVAITTALTVREYRSEEVPIEVISRILNSGRMTASAVNKQPWAFIVVQKKDTLRRIAELSRTGRHISGAAFAVAVINDPQNRWSTLDGARAVQNMTIQAWAEGLGSGWVGNFESDKVKELLSIPPNLNLLTVIPFGYPTVKYIGKKKRKPFSEIVFAENYGASFQARY